jgi:cysteine-rich repeat protein
LLQAAATLLALSFVLFALLSSLPGDPVELLVASNPSLSADDVARERRLRGLDQPLPVRWWRWLVGTPAAHAPPMSRALPPVAVVAPVDGDDEDDDDNDNDDDRGRGLALVQVPLGALPTGCQVRALPPATYAQGTLAAELPPGATRLVAVVIDAIGQEAPWSVDVFVAPAAALTADTSDRAANLEGRHRDIERAARAVQALPAPITRLITDEAPPGQRVVTDGDGIVSLVSGPPLLDETRFVCGAICALAFNLDGLGFSWAHKRPVAELLVGERPRCGDGRREAGEGCDDGNSRDGDGCDAGCFDEGSGLGERTATAIAGWLVSMGRIGHTLVLTVPALAIALVVSLLLGALAGWRGGRLDRLVTVGASLISSTPAFFIGLLLVTIVAERLQLLPAGGVSSPGIHEQGLAAVLVDRARHALLPVTVLAVVWSGRFVRQVRSGVIAGVTGDFVRTARMKGASEVRVVFRHVLPNAAVPLVTLVGLSLPSLFGGALIIETVFAWPGVGRLLYDAILQNDSYVAVVVTLLTAALVLLGSLCADLAVALIDPRSDTRSL